ncbi:MAG: hypothetical protein LBV27_04830 [Oscillospiraceae bacterium]|jgi:2,3-bisphosphoglycerate-independent phosphoglycerate mutase|nr:hypothetical protein [Oscillospiraceae bacterium]
MAALMIVLDGMQDIAYTELGGLTPYEYGRGEHFTTIEQNSLKGRLVTTPDGFEPDTQTCVLALLGVDPRAIPHGRSYIEALAVGLDFGPDDIIMRCNFVKIDEAGHLAVPCCSAPSDVAAALRAAVAAQDGYSITAVGSYKSLEIIKGAARYMDGLETSMPHQHQGEPLERLLPRGNALADTLAGFSRKMLAEHAPYTVFNWAQAVKSTLPAFSSLHPGLSGAMISKTDAPIGGAIAMGMACPPLPTATGDTDTDLPAKVRATLEMLDEHDFVMLHIGGPDEATHRQDVREKADFIAKLDREVIGPLLGACAAGTRIMVTCDHVGLCTTAGHTDDPVDFMLWEKGASMGGDAGTVAAAEAVTLLTHSSV